MNIADAHDSFLSATARTQAWQKNFLAQWYGPQIKLMIALTAQRLKNMPQPVREQLQQMNPQAWNEVMSEDSA